MAGDSGEAIEHACRYVLEARQGPAYCGGSGGGSLVEKQAGTRCLGTEMHRILRGVMESKKGGNFDAKAICSSERKNYVGTDHCFITPSVHSDSIPLLDLDVKSNPGRVTSAPVVRWLVFLVAREPLDYATPYGIPSMD